jgi:hypothetical protein
MKRCLKFVLSALVLLVGENAMSQPAAATSGCQSDHVKTSWGFQEPPLLIEQNSIMYSEPGTSYPALIIQNLGNQPITAVGMIVEYRDDRGNVIDRIPLLGGVREDEMPLQVPFPVERVFDSWSGPLMPGESSFLKGVKDGVMTRDCPTTAIVTFLRIKSVDTVSTIAENRWQVGPTPKTIPLIPMSQRAPILENMDIKAEIYISPAGRVLDLTSKDQKHLLILNWIRDDMRANWNFNPALSNGQPVSSS